MQAVVTISCWTSWFQTGTLTSIMLNHSHRAAEGAGSYMMPRHWWGHSTPSLHASRHCAIGAPSKDRGPLGHVSMRPTMVPITRLSAGSSQSLQVLTATPVTVTVWICMSLPKYVWLAAPACTSRCHNVPFCRRASCSHSLGQGRPCSKIHVILPSDSEALPSAFDAVGGCCPSHF